MNMTLRDARPSDAPLLRHWDEQPHVIAASGADGFYDWEAELPRRVAWRELLIAEAAERPIGFLQIIDPAVEERHYWGEIEPGLAAIDIWIGEAADLGRGLGTQMMRLALARCFEHRGARAVLIDPMESNVRANRFYERLGFRLVGPRRFGDDHCLVYRLEASDWPGLAVAKTERPRAG